MATISFCSSSLSTAIVSHNHIPTISLSRTTFGAVSFSSTFSRRLITKQSSFVPKLSETEVPVIEEVDSEIESEISVAEPSQVIEIQAEELPKGEDVFAVVMVGGRQYIVIPGRFLYVQRIKDVTVNAKIVLNKVLLVGTRTSTYLGQPVVPNAVIHAVVEEHGLNDKVIIQKYKKKKGYRRNIGHRQPNTRIRITSITGYQDSPALTLPSLP
ncbi:50S ribosomal protein L21, chloroplastic [Impatiens glandulifera]|uniref:50S ribosomal protein L21, chloroplastic n=1 Tax=Impatiens glandulifera TaxID=253017 RepID=UPI001FB1163E|nr:50S ribosomal protein L21, chloroplastic [Impatiens glandulifera]